MPDPSGSLADAARPEFTALSGPAGNAPARLLGQPAASPPVTDEIVRAAGLYRLTVESPPDDIEDALRALTAALQEADDLKREAVRLRAIEALAAVGVKGPARLVDAAAGRRKTRSASGSTQGTAVILADPEPWPDAVDGAALLTTIAQKVTHHVTLSRDAARALTLWVLHTYMMEALSISPILAITSPMKRCGKTLLLIVLRALAPRALPVSNLTPAALFRAIEAFCPTLLIDEADSFLRSDDDTLRGVLNSGHTRATAIVIRTVGDEHEVRMFSTWCAKAIALIGALPTTLADRAIQIKMRRRTASEPIGRLRQDHIDAECLPLRRAAARWAGDHREEIRAADPDVPSTLHDRAADCWRPLVAIADAAGGPWPEYARVAAANLGTGTDDDDEPAIALLTDVAEILETVDDDPIATATLVEHLVSREARPWREWRRGRPLTGHGLARLLKPFGIQAAGTVRIGPRTAKGYRRSAFVDAFTRYLSPFKPSQGNSTNVSGLETGISKRHIHSSCDALKSVTNPDETGPCYRVTLWEGENSGVDEQKGEGPDETEPEDLKL